MAHGRLSKKPKPIIAKKDPLLEAKKLLTAAADGKWDQVVSMVKESPALFDVRNDDKESVLMLAFDQDKFDAALALFMHYAKKYPQDREKILDVVAYFVIKLSDDVDACANKAEITKELIKFIEPIETTTQRLVWYALKLFLSTCQVDHEQQTLLRNFDKFIADTSIEGIKKKHLAFAFNNLSSDFDDTDSFSVIMTVALTLLPRNVNPFFLYYSVLQTYTQDESRFDLKQLVQHAAKTLEVKELVDQRISDLDNDDYIDFADYILRLMNKNQQWTYEASIVLLTFLQRSIAASNLDDKNTKIKLIKLQIGLCLVKLNRLEEAHAVLADVRLDNAEGSRASLVLIVAAFAEKGDFSALTQYASVTVVIEDLKNLIESNNFSWTDTQLVLQALHAQRLLSLFSPAKLINNVPFIIHAVKAKQEGIIKLYKTHQDVLEFKGEEFHVASQVKDENEHCTALYFAGMTGDLSLFDLVLSVCPHLYRPAPHPVNTKPFIFSLIESTLDQLSKLPDVIDILEIVVDRFPEELKRTWNNMSVLTYLHVMPSDVIACLKPVLQDKSELLTQELEKQILLLIMRKEIISQLLIGKVRTLEINLVDLTKKLREQIATLDSQINPYSGTGFIQVSTVFYNQTFLPWKKANERSARCYGYGVNVLPVTELRLTKKNLSDVNAALTFMSDFFFRSTPSLYSTQLEQKRERRASCPALFQSARPAEKKEAKYPSMAIRIK